MKRKRLFQTITRPILAKGIRLLALAVLLAGFAFAVQPAPLAYAATLTVTAEAPDVLDDDGSCSLREAITNANNNATTWADCTPAGTYGDDTINLPAGIFYIFSLVGTGENFNATGDLDILAGGGDLTINGAGGATINGGGVDRVFHVCPGGACDITVILDQVIIQGGHAGAGDGGGIYNNATLIVRNGSTIGSNVAGNYGGGIYNNTGATTVVDASTVSNNTASYGGGIRNRGTLTVQNGSIIGGASANIATSNGGGIYNNVSGTTTVDGSTVSNNTADDYGGGIYNRGTLTVQNGSIIGRAGARNRADYYGGGIYNLSGTTTVDGSTVSVNSARFGGGGICNVGTGTLTVQNGSTVSANSADDGGGIYNGGDGTTTVDGSTVSANTADYYGGGIYNGGGTLTVRNSGTIGGAGADNSADDGGGIYNLSGTTTVDGSTVSANRATDGGGIYNEGGYLTVQNGSTIGGAGAANTATDGGGIYNNAGTTTVDGSTVSANSANYGGGIYNDATLTVQNGSTIGGAGAGNTAVDYGGGIFNWSDGTTMVTGSRILYNTAGSNGGGVENSRNAADAISVTGSCIVGNSASSFLNTRSAQQTATGNWWGADTGPNTPDADTTSGNVDTSGFLAAPILGCPSGGSGVVLPIVVKNY